MRVGQDLPEWAERVNVRVAFAKGDILSDPTEVAVVLLQSYFPSTIPRGSTTVVEIRHSSASTLRSRTCRLDFGAGQVQEVPAADAEIESTTCVVPATEAEAVSVSVRFSAAFEYQAVGDLPTYAVPNDITITPALVPLGDEASIELALDVAPGDVVLLDAICTFVLLVDGQEQGEAITQPADTSAQADGLVRCDASFATVSLTRTREQNESKTRSTHT